MDLLWAFHFKKGKLLVFNVTERKREVKDKKKHFNFPNLRCFCLFIYFEDDFCRRENILSELLDTEERYVADLHSVLIGYRLLSHFSLAADSNWYCFMSVQVYITWYHEV
jgi:hypothetical protein